MTGTNMSLLSLGEDILHLIFEQLKLTDASQEIQDASPRNSQVVLQKFPKLYYQQRKTLPVLRLLCRTFNQVVLPVRFRSFRLKFTDLESDIARKVIGDVLKWSRCVILKNVVDWAIVERAYRGEEGVVLPNMIAIKWIFDNNSPSQEFIDTLTPIPDKLLRPDTRITFSAESESNQLITTISLPHLSHWIVGYSESHSHGEVISSSIANLKDYFLAARNLKSFSYSVASERWISGTQILPFSTFKPGERMPPLEVLALPSYQWNHSAAEVQSSWDFSHLTSLDIRGVPLYAFLSTVPFASFVHLRVLKIGDMAWSKKEECRSEGFLLLDQFLSGLRNLEELYLSSQTRGLSLKTFSCLPKLKILECREAVLVGGAVERGIRFNTEQLAQLREYCPYIRELAIDMDIVSTEFPSYLTTLRTFPRLTTITLYTRLQAWDPDLNLPHSPPPSPSSSPSPDTHITTITTTAPPPSGDKLKLPRRPNAHYTMFEAASKNLVAAGLFRKLTLYVGAWHDVVRFGVPREGNRVWNVERVFVWTSLTAASGGMGKIGGGRDYSGGFGI